MSFPPPSSSTTRPPFPVDSHCHLRFPSVVDEDNDSSSSSSLFSSSTSNFFCATAPSTDWDHISKLITASSSKNNINTNNNNFFGFGIHPWWATEKELSLSSSSRWKERLVQLLEKYPTACVAEIGLDKIKNASTPEEFSRQIEVFESQMDIAAALKRPVSVHCVRAHGPMFDLLMKRTEIEKYPSAFIFHGFTGSPDFVKSLLKLNKGRGSRFYFGFCSATTGTLKHFADLVKTVPSNRILVESDLFVNDPEEQKQSQERLWHMAERLHKESDGTITLEKLKENFLNAVRVVV